MTLRVRLALTILITAIPLVGGLMWLRNDVERGTIEETMQASATAFLAHHGWRLEDPEQTPDWGGEVARWLRRHRPGPEGGPPGQPGFRPGGRPRRPRGPRDQPGPRPRRPADELTERVIHWIWAYDAEFQSENPRAPALAPVLVEAMANADLSGAPCLVRTEPGGDAVRGYEIVMRVPGENPPCAYVLFRKVGGRMPAASTELLWASIVLCGVLLLAVLFAAGPIVGRIRRLTAEVRSAAAGRYLTQVPAEGNDEISALARAFNEAGAEVRGHLETSESREQALRKFVRNTSHDVMIPLTVLQGDLSDLRNRIERGDPPDRERVVQALEEAHYMGSLLHNLGAVAKLEGSDHQLQMHPVDLNALVQRAAERHRPLAHMRGIELEYGVPEPVLLTRGDLTLIEQAVSNVIHNAVRYNEEGGHVAVILEAPRDRPGRFSIQVIDDGPGIAPEDMERIAERRFRGEDARTRHPDGSGLGLNIARDVAKRHGMELEFRASEYGGLQVELSGRLLAGAEGEG